MASVQCYAGAGRGVAYMGAHRLAGAYSVPVGEGGDYGAMLGDRLRHARGRGVGDRLALCLGQLLAHREVKVYQHPVGAALGDQAVEFQIGIDVGQEVAGGIGGFHTSVAAERRARSSGSTTCAQSSAMRDSMVSRVWNTSSSR